MENKENDINVLKTEESVPKTRIFISLKVYIKYFSQRNLR